MRHTQWVGPHEISHPNTVVAVERAGKIRNFIIRHLPFERLVSPEPPDPTMLRWYGVSSLVVSIHPPATVGRVKRKLDLSDTPPLPGRVVAGATPSYTSALGNTYNKNIQT